MSALIYWQEQPVDMQAGETVAAALARAGIRHFGGGRHFCGIGQCQHCVVTDHRTGPFESCITPAVPGMRLSPLLEDKSNVAAG